MTEDPEPAQRPRQLLSIASLAAMFGVAPNTVHQWIKRGKDPSSSWPRFPEADYTAPLHVPGKQEKWVLLWKPSREPELLSYKAQWEARPGRNWRKGLTGSTRQPTFRPDKQVSMTEQPAKAAIISPHESFILASEDGQWHQTLCGTLGCGYESPEFDGRRYLAEIVADEHVRARASWPTIQEDLL